MALQVPPYLVQHMICTYPFELSAAATATTAMDPNIPSSYIHGLSLRLCIPVLIRESLNTAVILCTLHCVEQ